MNHSIYDTGLAFPDPSLGRGIPMVNLPPSKVPPPPTNKGLILGLVKGNQRLSQALIIRPAISGGEGT